MIVDEADRVQMQLDQMFAPSATLVTTGVSESWLDQLQTHEIAELARQGRLPLSDQDVERWSAALDIVGSAADRLYAMLIDDEGLRNWAQIDYFSAWTLQEKLLNAWYPLTSGRSVRRPDGTEAGDVEDETALYEDEDDGEREGLGKRISLSRRHPGRTAAVRSPGSSTRSGTTRSAGGALYDARRRAHRSRPRRPAHPRRETNPRPGPRAPRFLPRRSAGAPAAAAVHRPSGQGTGARGDAAYRGMARTERTATGVHPCARRAAPASGPGDLPVAPGGGGAAARRGEPRTDPPATSRLRAAPARGTHGQRPRLPVPHRRTGCRPRQGRSPHRNPALLPLCGRGPRTAPRPPQLGADPARERPVHTFC
ncbi:hypothetical protein NKH77_18815 [Streptomyces sp. M19]